LSDADLVVLTYSLPEGSIKTHNLLLSGREGLSNERVPSVKSTGTNVDCFLRFVDNRV
jgi:hypothetical protein